MGRSFLVLALLVAIACVVALSPEMSAFDNGVGDANEGYGCSTGCHTVQSSAVITMWSPTTNPGEGETVTLTVNVTGGEASDSPLGVMILSALATSGSLPSDTGWTILSDPTGTTTYNYHEIPAYMGSVSWTWTLQAPSTPDQYTLYAREIHGNGDTYSLNNQTGLTFIVGDIVTPGIISVVITSPTANSEVSDTITVAASMVPSADISYAILSIDGEEVDNKTSAPFLWTIDTHVYTDGAHVLNITATNATGAHGYEEITITVNNAGEETMLLSWVWTMAAGSILMIALIGTSMVVALLIRKHQMEKKVK